MLYYGSYYVKNKKKLKDQAGIIWKQAQRLSDRI
jgi:hypothetical protein